MSEGALAGIRVLDFSSALPGPLATLMLADVGAEVIKVERLDGDAGRADAAVFAILNGGKRSITLDLKADAAKLHPLIKAADILVEQFRPGVMDRLGLGGEAARTLNPRLIYVSINGYGSDSPDALRPGHDLTYAAESGLLSLNAGAEGEPVLPSALAADVAGGGYAAFGQIMMALYRRERTGEGARLEVAMFDGLMPFLAEALAHTSTGQQVAPRYSPATGSSPRYALYRTADGRYLALACPEEKFWNNFIAATGLPYDADRSLIAARLGEQTASQWMTRFEGHDLCCSIVATVAEAMATPRVKRLLRRRVRLGEIELPALPTPVAFRSTGTGVDVPAPGEANDLLDQLR